MSERKNVGIVNLCVILIFLFIAALSVVYNFSLPFRLNGDEIAIMASNRALMDSSYPGNELLSTMTYRYYVYPYIINALSYFFDPFTSRNILLFSMVFFTGYSAYIALRILGIRRSIAIVVAIVALAPRFSVGNEIFGVLTNYEVLGRSTAMPFLWIIGALIIKFIYDNKKIWPLFLLLGIVSYIHPVSILFFTFLALVISLFLLFWRNNFFGVLKQTASASAAFILGSSLLLYEIIFRLDAINSKFLSNVEYSSLDFLEAIIFRTPWDYPPESLMWIRHMIIILVFFAPFVAYVLYLLKKRLIIKESLDYLIAKWSILFILLSIFFSVFFPILQIAMIHLDGPFIFQQTSRFFKFVYFGIFLLVAVSLEELFRRNRYFLQKKVRVIFLSALLILGFLSSSFGFEWFQFLLGYENYQEEYIPRVFQNKVFEDQEKIYNIVCQQLKNGGVGDGDTVISNDFNLRYFCRVNIVTSFEEGSAYLMSGKNQLVEWRRVFEEQNNALHGDDIVKLIDFGRKYGANYALLRSNSALAGVVKEGDQGDLPISQNEYFVLIKF
ncbi:MAG: hypothetical protein PHW53_00230 [Patescibacteria group bacterium]|nr:hypothetical protein [Patescibacteria group bacterium]